MKGPVTAMTETERLANEGVLPLMVEQHWDDAISLRAQRKRMVRAPQIRLKDLIRHDDRLLAHLDGLYLAGDYAIRLARQGLAEPDAGSIFVATILAVQHRDAGAIDRLLSLVEVVPDAGPAMASAFGWSSAPLLRGLVSRLLTHRAGVVRALGIAVCAQHRVDPGDALVQALADTDPGVRAQGLRAVGDVGLDARAAQCMRSLADGDARCRFEAARTAVLLGQGQAVHECLHSAAIADDPMGQQALLVSLVAAAPDEARRLVRRLADASADVRTMTKAAAWTGDTRVVPWLFERMADDRHARIAAEALCFITGADLASLGLRRAPEQVPDDETASDEDDGLPWPDTPRLRSWWTTAQHRFPPGRRFFVGGAANAENCLRVLREGVQRHRSAAALHRAALQPGQPLFNTSAPGWRQRRLLAPGGLAGTGG
ncbi:TIGR02270 family protein [Rhizobacter sp. SG703]|uniref:TIGR02270 family protein n=1 Tax=Rhizobacter sp. SG703 TaxID=2587140 RepID=UPI00144712DA|nr:TIGR02270 family protein [Rhizobacter sp. SG703]NKI95266.1 uncharacterized protein (TIGR02270 family) [Rhizobacter sp. SG703]